MKLKTFYINNKLFFLPHQQPRSARGWRTIKTFHCCFNIGWDRVLTVKNVIIRGFCDKVIPFISNLVDINGNTCEYFLNGGIDFVYLMSSIDRTDSKMSLGWSCLLFFIMMIMIIVAHSMEYQQQKKTKENQGRRKKFAKRKNHENLCEKLFHFPYFWDNCNHNIQLAARIRR